MGTGGSSLGVKPPGFEADHSPQTNAEVKKTWIYRSTAQGQLYELEIGGLKYHTSTVQRIVIKLNKQNIKIW
jgi:hypothetical protein